MNRTRLTRRNFLAAAATSAAVPYFWPRRLAGAEDVNSQLTIGAIGVGGSRGRYNRGGGIARQAARFGRIVAVCDVDALHTGEFAEKFEYKINQYQDYRQLLEREKVDLVTIGTPDHWHVPISIAAMKAGCDVYCEKPLTLTIDEGKQICRVVRQTGRVFQVGSQQRTEYGQRFLKAVALAQSGRLGGNLRAYVAIGGAPAGGPFPNTDPPKELNWDMWLGPAPAVPYCVERRKLFRWWLEYSGGKMTDWGAHHIDIAQWALGCDHTGPVEVSGAGRFPPLIPKYDPKRFLDGEITLPNGFNTAIKFNICLKFANGTELSVNDSYTSPDGETSFGNGILIVGDEGRIFVNRARLSGKPVEELGEADRRWLDEEVIKLYGGKKPAGHMENFFQCIGERSLPISDVFTHHRTMTSCHLCNITLLLGRPLRWDPDREDFVGDEEASSLRWRRQREPYVTEI
ncbi:MAG TPA: Gfo/Idh/MocA family oxidoreductase [Planctomycetes bacterium]|nr:Gfo/Idh/MocA family oxidoreductase [Planctomycetota bacterium]